MRFQPRPAAASLIAAAGIFAITATTAFAGYPPGAFPGDAPAGAFPLVLISQTVCSDGGNLAVEDGSTLIRVDVPADAFAACHQITIYGVDESVIGHLLPDGYGLVTALAAGWDAEVPFASGGELAEESPHPVTEMQPASPLVLTLSNPSIDSDTIAFGTTSSALTGDLDFSVEDGVVRVELNNAAGVVVANPAEQDVEGNTGSPPGLPSTDSTAPGIDAGPMALLLVLVCLAALAAAGLVYARGRRHTS